MRKILFLKSFVLSPVIIVIIFILIIVTTISAKSEEISVSINPKEFRIIHPKNLIISSISFSNYPVEIHKYKDRCLAIILIYHSQEYPWNVKLNKINVFLKLQNKKIINGQYIILGGGAGGSVPDNRKPFVVKLDKLTPSLKIKLGDEKFDLTPVLGFKLLDKSLTFEGKDSDCVAWFLFPYKNKLMTIDQIVIGNVKIQKK